MIGLYRLTNCYFVLGSIIKVQIRLKITPKISHLKIFKTFNILKLFLLITFRIFLITRLKNTLCIHEAQYQITVYLMNLSRN